MEPEVNEKYINKKITDQEVVDGTLNVEEQKFYDMTNNLFKCHMTESDHSLNQFIKSSFEGVEDELS